MSSDIRLSPNYRVVLDVVTEIAHGSHLSAQEIFLRARTRQPRIGFATVHRGLARLSDLGYVLKLDVPGAPCAIYEPATSPHAHFRCTACSTITDLAYAFPQATRDALAEHHGLTIVTEDISFTGLCKICSDEPAI